MAAATSSLWVIVRVQPFGELSSGELAQLAVTSTPSATEEADSLRADFETVTPVG
ncbi:MAG: hypothetical protein ACRDSR_21650 [Pseudonocardiaceae bacterium]